MANVIAALSGDFVQFSVFIGLSFEAPQLRRTFKTDEHASLVREFIAYPLMDFQKFTDINMDIHDF